ncbi:MAG: hypothetical protein HY254_04065 [Burkholderiales bacterium]|nr:hypothetical protein [Burkholderiales bacterium]
MSRYFLFWSLALFSVQASADAVYKTYVNKRYGFVVDYPDYLKPQGEAANGDGQAFSSANADAELRVYARACIDEIDTTPEEFIARANKQQKKEGRQITYRAKGKSFAVVSGTKADNIFYDKVVIDGGWCSILEWTYPAANRDKYDEATRRIASSFKPELESKSKK